MFSSSDLLDKVQILLIKCIIFGEKVCRNDSRPMAVNTQRSPVSALYETI